MVAGSAKINSDKLHKIAQSCYDIISEVQSKDEALKQISHIAFRELGEFFGPYILDEPTQITVNFIELLDQILYTVYDSETETGTIRNYIIEDLHLRIGIYLEVLKSRELYKKSLAGRILTLDDTIIIQELELVEFIPDLMAEFYDQPSLQKPILKSLIKFDVEELMNFYYQIIKGIFCLEIKTLALLGMKCLSVNFRHWHLLKNIDSDLTRIVEYCEKFDASVIENNEIPSDIHTIFFVVNFIEMKTLKNRAENSLQWMFLLNRNLLDMNAESPLSGCIFQALSNTLLLLELKGLKEFVKGKNNLISFISLIDRLPAVYFNRIIGKLNLLGGDFIDTIQYLISSKKIKLKGIDSNILNFIFWVTSYKLTPS